MDNDTVELKLGPLRILRGYWIAIYWNKHCVSVAPRYLGDRLRWRYGFRLLWKD